MRRSGVPVRHIIGSIKGVQSTDPSLAWNGTLLMQQSNLYLITDLEMLELIEKEKGEDCVVLDLRRML